MCVGAHVCVIQTQIYKKAKMCTDLREISISRKVEAGKVHVRESRVHVHVRIRSGGGSAAVKVVLPVRERKGLVCLSATHPSTTDTCCFFHRHINVHITTAWYEHSLLLLCNKQLQ